MNRRELALQKAVSKVPCSWRTTIFNLLKNYYFLFDPTTKCQAKFSEGELALILHTLRQRELALCWMVRLVWRKSRPPFPIPYADAKKYKVLGAVPKQIYLLCEYICKESKLKTPYKKPADWFAAIHYEMITRIQMGEMLPDTTESKCKKSTLLQSCLEEVEKLKKYENFLPKHPFFSARYLLYEAAIKLAQQSEEFRKKFFKPLLKALAEEIRTLRGPSFCTTYIRSDGKAVRQAGKGNHVEVIELPEESKRRGAHLLY